MKKIIPIIIVIIMFGWAIIEFVNSSRDSDHGTLSTETTIEPGEIGLERHNIAPDFELTTLDGQQVRLSDYRGERVMLNFWATWCPPCRAEMPDMENFYQVEDVTILAVNMTGSEKNEEVVTDFVSELELTFPVLMDSESELVNAYQIHAYPTTYMIDSKGKIQFITHGAMNYDQMLQQLSRMN